tara:strand:+ start:160 stop:702 length:543 start_codon:yes stop_codon:yes gene_type:complete
MNVIRRSTNTPEENCQEIAQAIEANYSPSIKSFEVWTIPEIRQKSEELAGNPISGDMAEKISETLYGDLRNAEVFTPENIDRLIVQAFDQRFSEITIAPVIGDGWPPHVVQAELADKFIAIGRLAEDEPPKSVNDMEIITDFGKAPSKIEKFTQFVTEQTNHDVKLENPDMSQDSGMTPS